VPDGVVDVFPHECGRHGAVRAHVDHRRRGRVGELLGGCTAPKRDTNQLHAAVVELVALDNATIKYSTVQNWYAGDAGRSGRDLQLRHQAREALRKAKISWTQVETGSAITWKYPSVILQGDDSVGEFYSVAVVNGRQQADTGTKMIHMGKNTRSTSSRRGFRPGGEQQLSRAGEGSAQGGWRQELHPVRFDADRQWLWRRNTFPYIDVQTPQRRWSTRPRLEDRRGPDLLLQAAGPHTENATR